MSVGVGWHGCERGRGLGLSACPPSPVSPPCFFLRPLPLALAPEPAHAPLWRSFDLMYYDQMAERDEAVRLTLHRSPDGGSSATGHHVAPLEAVILTRWPAAQVDWNGEEIIL